MVVIKTRSNGDKPLEAAKKRMEEVAFFLLRRACVSCYTSADKRSYSILGSLAPSMGCRGHRNHKVPSDKTLCLEWSG